MFPHYTWQALSPARMRILSPLRSEGILRANKQLIHETITSKHPSSTWCEWLEQSQRHPPLHSSSRSVGLHCPTLNTTSFSREIFYAIQNSKESLLNNRLTSYERIFNRLYDKLECDVYYYCVCRPTTCNMSFNVHQSFPRKKPNKHWRFSFNYLRHSSP